MSPVSGSAGLRFAAAQLGAAAREQAVVARERSMHTLDCRGPAVGACVADTGYRHVCSDRGQGRQSAPRAGVSCGRTGSWPPKHPWGP